METNGYIAYFDVLGFSELIRVDSFSSTITKYNKILQDAVNRDDRNLDYIFFSDSVIIHSNNNQQTDLLDISLAISEITYRLVTELELTISGCISYGSFTKLQNDGNVMITGTPILDAVGWEKKQNWIGTVFSPLVVRQNRILAEISQIDVNEIYDWKKGNYDFLYQLFWKTIIQKNQSIPIKDGYYEGYAIVPINPFNDKLSHFEENLHHYRDKLDELKLFASDSYVQDKYSSTINWIGRISIPWYQMSRHPEEYKKFFDLEISELRNLYYLWEKKMTK
jgi:hypothetical protein